MARNPNNGRLSTRCPSSRCNNWNDWTRVTGLGKDLKRWDKPLQCSKCGRQLAIHPEAKEHRLGIADHAPQQRLKGVD